MGLPRLHVVDTESGAGEEFRVSPVGSPSSRVEALRVRQLAFLRKRLGFRWCYGEELRALIFEDMLEEASALRPIAGEVLAGIRAQVILEGQGFQDSKSIGSEEDPELGIASASA